MSNMRKTRKVLMFVTFIGFALIMRAAVDFFMDEPINLKLTVAGVVIVLIGIYFSRRFMPDGDR